MIKLRHVFGAVVLAVLIERLIVLPAAMAHSGSPAMVTWSSGATLTSSDLNNALAHLHNTFSAGIVDAHVNSSAAIAHSKLATPALVAKAVLTTTTACVGGGAAGTDCTTNVEHSKFLSTSGGAGNGNSALEATGTTGRYYLTLSYTPTNNKFVVLATAGSADDTVCAEISRSTTAPHITLDCETAGADADVNIHVVVFDTD